MIWNKKLEIRLEPVNWHKKTPSKGQLFQLVYCLLSINGAPPPLHFWFLAPTLLQHQLTSTISKLQTLIFLPLLHWALLYYYTLPLLQQETFTDLKFQYYIFQIIHLLSSFKISFVSSLSLLPYTYLFLPLSSSPSPTLYKLLAITH